MRCADVVVIGDALLDRQYFVHSLPAAGGDSAILSASCSVGGSALNTALDLSALGVRCAFCGRAARDDAAEIICARLYTASVPIDTELFLFDLLPDEGGNDFAISSAERTLGAGTGYTITFIDDSGERTMFSFRGANALPMYFNRDIKDKISAARMILLSGYYLLQPKQAEFTLKAAGFAKSSGGIVLFDPSPMCHKISKDILTEALQYTDILLPNESELDYLKAFDGGLGTSIIAEKKGKNGAALYLKKGAPMPDGSMAPTALSLEAPACVVEAVDSTGAGDAFNAGLIAAFLRGDSPAQWLEAGNKTAARVVAQRGGSLS